MGGICSDQSGRWVGLTKKKAPLTKLAKLVKLQRFCLVEISPRSRWNRQRLRLWDFSLVLVLVLVVSLSRVKGIV